MDRANGVLGFRSQILIGRREIIVRILEAGVCCTDVFSIYCVLLNVPSCRFTRDVLIHRLQKSISRCKQLWALCAL